MADHSDFGQLQHPRRKVSFDPTINLGHILTFCGFIAAGFGAYSALDKRVAIVEQVTASQDARFKDALTDIKSEVRETRRTVDDLARSQLRPTSQGK